MPFFKKSNIRADKENSWSENKYDRNNTTTSAKVSNELVYDSSRKTSFHSLSLNNSSHLKSIQPLAIRISDDDSEALCIRSVLPPGRDTHNHNARQTTNDMKFQYSDSYNLKLIKPADDHSWIDPSLGEIWNRRTTRRRLNWRIGPLMKKKPKNNNKSAKKIRSDRSIASATERTVKSIHTAHSIETTQMANHKSISTASQKGFIPRQNHEMEQNIDSLMTTIESYKLQDYLDTNGNEGGTVVVAFDESDGFDPNRNEYRTLNIVRSNSTTLKDRKCHPVIPQSNFNLSMHQKRLPPKILSAKSQSKDFRITNDSSLSTRTNHENESVIILSKLQAISEGCISQHIDIDEHLVVDFGAASTNSDHGSPLFPFKTNHLGNASCTSTPSTVESETSHKLEDDVSVNVQAIQSESNLKAIHILALQHLSNNEFDQTIYVLKEMLRGLTVMFGPSHPRVGTLHHNIATVYMRMGYYNEVISHAQNAVLIRRLNLLEKERSHSDSNHLQLSDLATSYTQLGLAYLELSDFESSLQMLHKALSIRRKMSSGSAMIKCSRLLNNIGYCLYELKRFKDAKVAFHDSFEIQRRLLNFKEKSKTTVTSSDAKVESSEEISRRLLGIASTLYNLASVEVESGYYNEALLRLEEALLLQQSVLGDGHAVLSYTQSSIDFIERKCFSPNDTVRSFAPRSTNMIQSQVEDNNVFEKTYNQNDAFFDTKRSLRRPLEALSDVKSELLQLFDTAMKHQTTCFQCSPDLSLTLHPTNVKNDEDCNWI